MLLLLPVQPVYDLDDVVRAWNALPAAQRGQVRWTRWKVRAVLEACQLEFLPRKKGEDGKRGGKLMFTLGAWQRALQGDLVASMLDAEAASSPDALREADEQLDALAV